MEKWIKRRFQKVHFFLRDMQADEKNIAKLRSLTRRVKDYSSKKPWRKEIHRFGKEAQVQVSDHGTSTPFSHYSSFDSQDSSRKLQAKNQKIENIFYESKETKSFNSQVIGFLTNRPRMN